MNDLRYGLRRMARSPLFHLAAVTALGLGIGANTAIFSLVNAVLLRQLPFQNPEELVGDYRPALPMLQGVVAAVLLMTCANLANLLLAQRAARQREMEIRSAVGASRGRLVRQLLMEGLLLATAGGLVGLGVAVWGVGALAAWSPASLPRAGDIALDGRVLAFTTGVSLLVGLACGLLPALPARAGGGQGSGVGGRGWGAGLVVAEVALAVVLLATAGLLARSFRTLQAVSPGFDTRRALAVRLALPPGRYGKPELVKVFWDQVAARLRVLPGVEGVGLVNVLPLSGMNVRMEFSIAGRPPARPTDTMGAQNRWVTPGYFATLGIPVLRGREFREDDTGAARGVAVVDQALAQHFFGGRDPVGEHVRIEDPTGAPREAEIVGVAGDVKHNGLEDEPTPTLYLPMYQVPAGMVSFLANNLSLVVRTGADPLALAGAVRREVQATDREVAASGMRTVEQLLGAAVESRRFNILLIGVFAAVAAALAASGIYAVVAFAVARRTREIGIRMAVGARPGQVVRMLVRDTGKLVLVGAAIGLGATLGLGRILAGLLFRVREDDPATLAGTGVLVVGIGLLAAWLPARRAARVDPKEAISY